jgi:hypothetical protein
MPALTMRAWCGPDLFANMLDQTYTANAARKPIGTAIIRDRHLAGSFNASCCNCFISDPESVIRFGVPGSLVA